MTTTLTGDDLREHFRAERITRWQAERAALAADLPAFIRSADRLGVTDYTIHVETAEEFRAVLMTHGDGRGHNHYRPADAVEALSPLIARAMRVTIKFDVTGPHILMSAPFTYAQQIGHVSPYATRLPAEERIAFYGDFLAAGVALNADERHTRTTGWGKGWKHTEPQHAKADIYEARLWWD